MQVAHSFKEKSRTGDVLISEDVDFSGLLLSAAVLNGLHSSGFVRPSPIQLKAIPLGRCGLDLIVQAKSGTGKTCVFSVIALESIATDTVSTQVLVLAPTREIAVQIWEVINSIGSAISGLACHTFIGGLPVPEDRVKLRKCHVAVGSPGRIKQLIECGALKTDSIRLFVLDEADKLLEESFQEQINWIYSTLPDNKQMLALSATYPEYLAKQLTHYMRNPTYLRLNITDPALLGIRQYHKTVPYHSMAQKVFEYKSEALKHILSSISFQQCLVFSNLQTRAQTLADSLVRCGWPTACIAGRLDQKERNEAMAKLKTYKCRILISTDLTSRGIDADKVNLVINLDVPKDHETYLHRIGRAGRFGAFGIAITLVSEGQEMLNLNALEKRCNTQIRPVPDPIPSDLAKAESPVSLDDVVSTQVLHTDKLKANMSNNQVTEFGSKIETMSADVPNISQTDEGQTKATINDGQHTQIVKDRSSTFFQNPTDINGYMDTTDFSKMNGHTSPKDSVIGNITNAKHQAINLENENATGKNEDDNKENQNITQGSQAVKKDETIKPADQKHLDQSINTGVSFDLGSPCKEFIIEGRSSTNAVAEDESDSSLESADDNTDEKQLFSYSATNSVVLSRDVSTGFELNLASDEKQRLSEKMQTKKRKKEICEKVKERIDIESNCQIHSLKEDTKYTGQRNYDSEVYRNLETNNDYEYNTNRLSLQKLKVNVPDIFKKNIKYKPKQKYYTYQAGMLSLKAFCDNKESENGDKAYHPNLCLNGVDDKSEDTLELQEAVKNLLDQFDINFKLGRNEMNRTQQRQRKVTFCLSAEENEDMGPVSTDQVVKNVVIESMTELSNTKCTEEIIMESEKSKNVNKEHGKKKIISQSAKDLKNREGYSKYKEECNETSTKNKGFQKKTKSSASKIVDYKGKFAIGHLLSQEREYFVNESQNTKSPSDGPHKAETGHKIKHNAENKSSLERPNENQLLIAPSGIQGKEYCVKDQHSAVTGDIGTRADQSCSNRKTYNPVDLTINRNKSRYRHSSSSINREEVRDSDVRESQHSSSEFSEDSSSDSDSISSSSEEYAVPKISKHGRAHKHDKYKYSDSARYTNNRKDKKTENCNSQTYCNTWLLHNSSQEQHPHQSNKMFPTFNEQYSYSHHHQSQGPIYYRPAKHTSPYNQQAYPNYGQQYLRQPDQYLYQPQYMLPWQHHYGKRYYPYSTYNQNYPSHGFYFPVQPAQDRKSYEDNLEAAYRMQRDYIQKMSKFPS